MPAEKFRSKDFLYYRLLEEKNTELHESVCNTLSMAQEQVALSLKTVSQSRALIVRVKQTLRNSNEVRAGLQTLLLR